jgi:hypothetical protein
MISQENPALTIGRHTVYGNHNIEHQISSATSNQSFKQKAFALKRHYNKILKPNRLTSTDGIS